MVGDKERRNVKTTTAATPTITRDADALHQATDRLSTCSSSPPQYRAINTSNAGFLRDVVSVEGGVKLMVALGFREDLDGQLVLPAVSKKTLPVFFMVVAASDRSSVPTA